jgi:hypothetical protein
MDEIERSRNRAPDTVTEMNSVYARSTPNVFRHSVVLTEEWIKQSPGVQVARCDLPGKYAEM